MRCVQAQLATARSPRCTDINALLLCLQFIIDAQHWRTNVQEAVEAIFYLSPGDRERAQQLLESFRSQYGQPLESYPLIRLVPSAWDSPFRLG